MWEKRTNRPPDPNPREYPLRMTLGKLLFECREPSPRHCPMKCRRARPRPLCDGAPQPCDVSGWPATLPRGAPCVSLAPRTAPFPNLRAVFAVNPPSSAICALRIMSQNLHLRAPPSFGWQLGFPACSPSSLVAVSARPKQEHFRLAVWRALVSKATRPSAAVAQW